MMSGAKKRAPKRRFKEFLNAGDWEQRKLGSIGSTYTGLSGKTKEDFGHGEAKYITYLNVFQNTISNITMTDKVEIDPTQNEVKYGDVLFTTSSETPEEVGMSSVWLGDTPNIYLNSFCFGFRPNQKIDSYFLGYSLRAPYMRDRIKILAQGISRYNISKNKVMELEISLPNNEEQKLLGTFLQRIDLIITLHQRKLDKLQATKKALLQEMFPEEGQDKPKRRFKGFTDAWEQRKLGNIVDFLDGQRKPLKESERTKGKYPYYGASGIIDYINDYLFDENLVLLSEDGANIIDRNYPVCFIATGKYWVNNHAHVLKVKTGVIDKFICESLERLDYTKFNTGTAQPKLNQDICQKIVITIPNEDEQKCISEFLDRINNIITLHQHKLDKLKNLKQAYLNEMFV